MKKVNPNEVIRPIIHLLPPLHSLGGGEHMNDICKQTNGVCG